MNEDTHFEDNLTYNHSHCNGDVADGHPLDASEDADLCTPSDEAKLYTPGSQHVPYKSPESEVKNVCSSEPGLSNHGSFQIEPDVSITFADPDRGVSRDPPQLVKRSSVKKQIRKKLQSLNRSFQRRSASYKLLKERQELSVRQKLVNSKAVQSNVSFQCYKCGSSEFSCLTNLNSHLEICEAGLEAAQSKGARKLYLCSACDNYYENWNLFLHMKEVHNRNICLHCLRMFSQTEKLAQHLQVKHNIHDVDVSSEQAIIDSYREACVVVCCECEAFIEPANLPYHACSPVTHYPTSHKSDQSAFNLFLSRKGKKKQKDIFKVVNKCSSGELSVTVRKQSDKSRRDDEAAMRQHNEKMLQLYRPTKPADKVTSSLQSIEDSINRVIDSFKSDADMEEEEDINMATPVREEHPVCEQENNILQEEVKPPEHPVEQPAPCTNNNLSDGDSSDSEKLTIALDCPVKSDDEAEKVEEGIATAGPETSFLYLSERNLEEANARALLKECIQVSARHCVYCAHARCIAVNGKQLGLHILAEHRVTFGTDQDSEEDKTKLHQQFVEYMKGNLDALDNSFLNMDTYDSEMMSEWRPNIKMYECFPCSYATKVHKELCSHNRKLHQKSGFLCIMCKSSFYNYNELLCHLCPGIYIPGQVVNMTYHCYACDVPPLASAFRLMVHLRRKHNSCDICFEVSSTPLQLSTHVWKHKQSHMCYRCGISYRNKPDMTKHLFWKHGTESVVCKKCLHKKWPHVYHFCIPPSSFLCDECTVSFKSAVALRVHKRLHTNNYPYTCDKCQDKFISKKLLERHKTKHEEEDAKVLEPPQMEVDASNIVEPVEAAHQPEEPKVEDKETTKSELDAKAEKKSKKKKSLNDVLDLPPVNLSESDDSEDEVIPAAQPSSPKSPPAEQPVLNGEVEKEVPPQVIDGVWDNFQNYLVGKEGSVVSKQVTNARLQTTINAEHDYCLATQDPDPADTKKSRDHDYCDNNQTDSPKKEKKQRQRTSSTDSSTESDSSCSCGSNCSCSSSSSSSSSGTESAPSSPEKKRSRKKMMKKKKATVSEETVAEIEVAGPELPNENVIRESDLETDETDTDEDFYDLNPAKEANRWIEEKRTQIMANLNGDDAPPATPEVPPPAKKKSRSKKKRPQLKTAPGVKYPRKKPVQVNLNGMETPLRSHPPLALVPTNDTLNHCMGDEKGRRPKRKRCPLKFYGFSSEDESDVSSAKRRQIEHTSTPTTASRPPTEEPTSIIWKPPVNAWKAADEMLNTPRIHPIKIRASLPGSELFHIKSTAPPQMNGGQKNEKLYCYCRFPYDEVSEMIACDAANCAIEWFHFECVGIMVPPKGSWYCPDCEKKFAAANEFLTENTASTV